MRERECGKKEGKDFAQEERSWRGWQRQTFVRVSKKIILEGKGRSSRQKEAGELGEQEKRS